MLVGGRPSHQIEVSTMSPASDTVLVTGGTGYIGSHACKALSRAGYLPVVYDCLERGHAWAVNWGPLETGDIADAGRLASVFEAYRPAAVMHFAAYAYVGESVAEPALYYGNNVRGRLTLSSTMRAFDVDRLVFSSTGTTYGTPDALSITEDHPQDPINPYDRSKLMIERILRDVGTADGLRTMTLRYFNAAGADPDGDIGEAHDPEPRLVPRVLRTAAGLKDHLPVNGSDYATLDGTCIRDYVHVTDLAEAHVLALTYLSRGWRVGLHQSRDRPRVFDTRGGPPSRRGDRQNHSCPVFRSTGGRSGGPRRRSRAGTGGSRLADPSLRDVDYSADGLELDGTEHRRRGSTISRRRSTSGFRS